MNNLFVYGCSFTHGNGCLPYDAYYKQYRKSEDDLIWPEIIANELGYKLYNYVMGAISNDVIVDNMIETFDAVSEGDIVIIKGRLKGTDAIFADEIVKQDCKIYKNMRDLK
jgi:hypothetical protein